MRTTTLYRSTTIMMLLINWIDQLVKFTTMLYGLFRIRNHHETYARYHVHEIIVRWLLLLMVQYVSAVDSKTARPRETDGVKKSEETAKRLRRKFKVTRIYASKYQPPKCVAQREGNDEYKS